MPLGINSDETKNSILEKEPEKLKEELKAKQKELGLRDMIPQGNQSILQQIKDIGAEASHIKERMAEAKEKRLKRTAEERKAKSKSVEERIRLYFAKMERKAKQAYESRRIVFIGGGFEDYEQSIRMTSYRVLLKELPHKAERDGIVIPDAATDKFPKYAVIAVGDGCDGIEEGMAVITEAYSGTEIKSNDNTYKIVTYDDILGEIND